MDKRDKALLDTIDKFKTLPVAKQRELRPLFEATINRHRNIKINSDYTSKHIKELFEDLKRSLN